ncbi:ABC transporter ATP-binding protein [Youxingia wuxianensis]|uniref:ABC transporter ATP-binding protein n=1 Tax=Youxingia wuxianensis TaxID=2763678 RepID=A0A926EQH8_9FIRM|nr:ABC transporter ATP-binding protein [Youxingia wuxianensis]MBC8584514.1 ABC transporter ATP-binding protein [Youxingia wuxianensis]
MTDAILELKGLSKYFGGIKANDDVNMSIERGELHCLIGPNGAGKSTIFRMIMGEYPPTKGEIIYEGKNITKLKMWQRAYRGISIKMQIPGVFGELSLYDNIRIALQKHVSQQEVEAEIQRLIHFVGIQDLGNPLVKNMSHGQQQWLEIAMALALRPKLLLLDEPAAGMGPEETEFTAQLVKKINAQGITVIFIDHDMNFVRRIAKRVTVLHCGKIFKEGPLEEIEADKDVIQIYLGED